MWTLEWWKEVVGWLERRGVRCLEVWLGKDVGDLAVCFGLKGGRRL